MNKVVLLANTSQEFSDDVFEGRSDCTRDHVIMVPVQKHIVMNEGEKCET